MSGSVSDAPLRVQVFNPTQSFLGYNQMLQEGAKVPLIQAETATEQQKPGLFRAQTGETQARSGLIGAQSGLIGAQTTGAEINNQVAAMQLGIGQQFYQQMFGRSGSSAPVGAVPWETQAPATPAIGGASPADAAMPRVSTGSPALAAPNPALGRNPTRQGASSVAPAGDGGTALPSISMYTTEAQPAALSGGGAAAAPGEVATPNLDETMKRLRQVEQTPVLPQEKMAQAAGAAPQSVLGAPAAAAGAPVATPQTGPAIGAGAPAAAPAIGQPPENMPYTTGPGGGFWPGVALPMPSGLLFGIYQAQDKPAAIQQALNTRNFMIQQLAQSTIDPQSGKPDPNAWNQAVKRAYDTGLIDNYQAWRWYNHPNIMQQAVQGTLSPTEQPGYKAAVTAAETGAKAGIEPREINVPGPGGTVVPTQMVRNPDGTYRQINTPAGGAPQPQGPNVAAPYGSPLAQKMQLHENNSANPAQGNMSGPGGTATSSAMGNHQWTADTWRDAVNKYAPDVVKGMSDAQVQALRGNPQFSAAIFDARAPELAAGIQQAFPDRTPTDATVALAHGFGVAGAKTLLQAPGNATLAQVLPEAAKANPSLANQTAYQIVSGYARDFGTTPFQPVQAAQGGGGGEAPAAGGVGAGVPQYSQPQQKAIDAAVTQNTKYQDELVAKAQASQRSNALLDQARIESQTWTSGAFADAKMTALKYADAIRQNVNSLFGRDVLGAPDQSVGNWEAFNKNMMENVRTAVRETSARAAVQEFNMIRQAQPNSEMSPQGTRQLFDELQGIGDWTQAKSQAAARLRTTDPGAANQFEAEWNNNVSPQAFMLHRMSTPDFQALSAKLSQSAEGRQALGRWVDQMRFLDRHGFFQGTGAAIPTGRQPAPAQ